MYPFRPFRQLLVAAVVLAAGAAQAADRPTVVLVHGAFADTASWNAVAGKLGKDGYPVISAPNPLRSLSGDARAVSALVKSVKGPVILVGHSYGGSVISNVNNEAGNISGLVYVAALAPDAGESTLQLTGKFPGGTLGAALAEPVALADGGVDLYVRQEAYPAQVAADVPVAVARLMAVSQRPVTQAALEEQSGAPLWRSLPSWFIYGDADKNVPPQALGWMAQRAGSRHTVVLKGASHAPMVSRADEVAALIEQAAQAARAPGK